jgi:hypothetical protein
MRITLQGGFVVDIPVHEMQRPLRGLDRDGQPVLDEDHTELQIYGREASGFAPVLGKAFLSQVTHSCLVLALDHLSDAHHTRQVYLFVDEQCGIFKLAPQAPEVTTPVPVSSAACTSALSPSDKGLIAVGSVLGALIVALAAYAVFRRFRPAGTVQTEENTPSPNTPGTGPSVTSPIEVHSRESSISLHAGALNQPGERESVSIHGFPARASTGPVSTTSAGVPPAGRSSPISSGILFTGTGISG